MDQFKWYAWRIIIIIFFLGVCLFIECAGSWIGLHPPEIDMLYEEKFLSDAEKWEREKQELESASRKNELNLVFQNLKLDGKNMLTQVCEPFNTMIGYKECPTNWRWRDAFRTFDWGGFRTSFSQIACFKKVI